jgi:hypothetical protein
MRTLPLLALLALAAPSMTGCHHHRARYMYGPGYYGRPVYVQQPQAVYVQPQPQPVYVQPQPTYVQPASATVVVQPGY